MAVKVVFTTQVGRHRTLAAGARCSTACTVHTAQVPGSTSLQEMVRCSMPRPPQDQSASRYHYADLVLAGVTDPSASYHAFSISRTSHFIRPGCVEILSLYFPHPTGQLTANKCGEMVCLLLFLFLFCFCFRFRFRFRCSFSGMPFIRCRKGTSPEPQPVSARYSPPGAFIDLSW